MMNTVAERFIEKNGYVYHMGFAIWSSYICERLNLGGIFIGNKWVKPSHLDDYSYVINKLLPNCEDDMLLFCQCKFRVEFIKDHKIIIGFVIFFLALAILFPDQVIDPQCLIYKCIKIVR